MILILKIFFFFSKVFVIIIHQFEIKVIDSQSSSIIELLLDDSYMEIYLTHTHTDTESEAYRAKICACYF